MENFIKNVIIFTIAMLAALGAMSLLAHGQESQEIIGILEYCYHNCNENLDENCRHEGWSPEKVSKHCRQVCEEYRNREEENETN